MSAPDRGSTRERSLQVLLPVATLALGIWLWHEVVRAYAIPPYVLPGPGLVAQTLVSDWEVLGGSLLVTLATTFQGLLLAVVGVGLLENITANRAQLTIVALLLVGAFVVLRYRDLARGLLTMVPVLIAVGTSAVLVRVLGITLSPLSTVSGPLVVATCGEFAVLLIARYAEERDRGLDPERSTHMAAKHTGRAFFTSALTTLGGFAVLMFSSLPLLADFGTVVTINIGVALLSALVVVPPLVKEADRRGLPCYVETSKPRNVTFYEKQGFVVNKEIAIPMGGPPLWTLIREPVR